MNRHGSGRSVFLAVCVVSLAWLVVTGRSSAQSPETLAVARLRQLVLVDKEGRTRAELSVGPDDSTQFILRHPDGKRALRLGVLASGDLGISFVGPEGSSRMGMALMEDGTPAIVLRDSKANDRAALHMDEHEGAPSLAFWDPGAKKRLECRASSGGAVYIRMQDPAVRSSISMEVSRNSRATLNLKEQHRAMTMGEESVYYGLAIRSPHVRARLSLLDEGKAGALSLLDSERRRGAWLRGGSNPIGLVLSDAHGRGRVRVAVADDHPVFGLTDKRGQPIVTAEERDAAGVIELHGKDGRVLWTAPKKD